MQPGDTLTLDVEKPVAGGRMLARHGGRIVLVGGAIPGERVAVRIERVSSSVAYGQTLEVIAASPDRRPIFADWRCGGNVYAHVAYARQLELKAAIVADAFARIARLPLASAPHVEPSPESGYRMRARLHACDGVIGFFREGTHEVCAASEAGQLLSEASEALSLLQRALSTAGGPFPATVDFAENAAATERCVHLDMGVEPVPSADVFEGISALTGVTASSAGGQEAIVRGGPYVHDTLDVLGLRIGLRRHVRAFFQGNRYLLRTLVTRVIDRAGGAGDVLDLYAGGGLFAVAIAARGGTRVTAIEGDALAGRDLRWNGRLYGKTLRTFRRPVEAHLRDHPAFDGTIIVDPPRTGLSPEASSRLRATGARRVVYVSCDVATLARDVKALMGIGYQVEHVEAFDLFPNTAHVETLAVLGRRDAIDP
jgi:23S rRNA (uracil1939-C5)-methyltransferase